MRDDERILVDEVKGSVDFLSTSKNLLNRKVITAVIKAVINSR